jgi:DNA-binding NarL/FixJ family response regulator
MNEVILKLTNIIKGGPRLGRLSRIKTLLVEDSDIFRNIVKETLESEFPLMEIFEANNSQEALRIVENVKPDLIFMDINLHGENGLVITEKIKPRYPELMIIILTNYDTPEYREAAHRVKADYFLPKNSIGKEVISKLVESTMKNLENSHSVVMKNEGGGDIPKQANRK